MYHCNYCHRDISDNIRIKCAVCADFDLCVECFSVGVEINGHSNEHSYKVMDNLSFPIFHPNWGSDEELLLLEAVEIYGPGNWAAVSEHVGTKSTEECLSHYHQIYIQPGSFPLPTPAPEMAGLDVKKLAELAKSSCGRKRMRLDMAAAQQQLKQLLQQDQADSEQPSEQQQQPPEPGDVQVKQEQPQQEGQSRLAAAAAADGIKLEDAAAAAGAQQQQDLGADGSPAGQSGHGKVSFRQRAAGEAAAAAAAGSSAVPSSHATVGSLGKIHPYGSPAQQQQQQQPADSGTDEQQQGVTQEGAEAAAAAAGASGRSLGPSQAAAAAAGDAPRVKGSGPQLDMMTGWHAKRFEFEPEWDNDAEASIAEIEFKETDTPGEEAAKLRLLEIYNKRLDERARRQSFILENGLLHVRRMQGTEKRRLPGEREKHAQMRVFARYQPPGSHEGLVEGLLLEGRLRLRIAELQAHRAAGRRTMAEIEEAELSESANKKKSKDKMAVAAGLLSEAEAAVAGGGSLGPATLGGYRSTASALSVYRQRQGVALDISSLPGSDKLTAREAELCASARLLPIHYLSLKDVMMRDAQVHGHISRFDARTFFRLDSSRSARIWEVLCAAGWLKDNHPDEAEDKRRGPRAKKEAQLQLQQQQSMTLAAAASLAVGFPPSTNSDGSKSVSVAEAAAAAAAVLGLPVPAALAAESGGEGLASEATGATNSDAMVADMDDDDDFMP